MDQENQLIVKLRTGSKDAFTQVYEQYFDLLYGFVFNLIRSHETTREIAQDTFVKVWIHRQSIDTSQSFKAFLYTIAKNRLVNELKSKFRNPLFDDYLDHCENESLAVLPENSYDFNQFLLSLSQAKTKLTPRQREAFELYMEEGLQSAEVASRMGISEQAFFNHLSKALSFLRSSLHPFSPLLLLLFKQ